MKQSLPPFPKVYWMLSDPIKEIIASVVVALAENQALYSVSFVKNLCSRTPIENYMVRSGEQRLHIIINNNNNNSFNL